MYGGGVGGGYEYTHRDPKDEETSSAGCVVMAIIIIAVVVMLPLIKNEPETAPAKVSTPTRARVSIEETDAYATRTPIYFAGMRTVAARYAKTATSEARDGAWYGLGHANHEAAERQADELAATSDAFERMYRELEIEDLGDGSHGYECLQCIKGNISVDTGERIYHLPGCEYYESTVIRPEYGERWFSNEEEARTAGWRKARNCP